MFIVSIDLEEAEKAIEDAKKMGENKISFISDAEMFVKNEDGSRIELTTKFEIKRSRTLVLINPEMLYLRVYFFIKFIKKKQFYIIIFFRSFLCPMV